MGVNNLWTVYSFALLLVYCMLSVNFMQAVAPAGDKHSLLEYATSWAVARKHNPSTIEGPGTNRLRLGVDAK
jgi:hypothetical protein